MEASEEDKSPFDLSEDGPPTLSEAISNAHEGKRKGNTDISHGVMI